MRFRLIHLLGTTTLLCVLFGIGRAFGWYWPVALSGFALLGVALSNWRRRPLLSLFAVWCAFILSLLIPAVSVSLQPTSPASEGRPFFGWQAAYFAVNEVRLSDWKSDRLFTLLQLLGMTCANGILAILPLWIFVKPQGRLWIGCILAVGALCHWCMLMQEDRHSLFIGYYLWATTITVASLGMFLSKQAA